MPSFHSDGTCVMPSSSTAALVATSPAKSNRREISKNSACAFRCWLWKALRAKHYTSLHHTRPYLARHTPVA
mgnify:CR=1 FL=1